MENKKSDDERLRPEDRKDETLRKTFIDKFKEIEFDDMKIIRTILRLKEEEIKYFTSGNKTKNSVDETIIRDYEQCFLQDLGSFLRFRRRL